MSENPYQSPETERSTLGEERTNLINLRSVAKYQRRILFCILINLTAFVLKLFLPPQFSLPLTLAIFGAGIAGSVFVFQLALEIYRTALAILLGLLTLIPCVGLIVLLIINGEATTILKENGIKVGLLGANISRD